MRQIVLFLLLTGLNTPVMAQKLSFAQKDSITTQILQRVGAAYGFGILDLPKLIIVKKSKVNQNRNIAHLQMISAWLQQPDNSLYRSRLFMDEELFDLCTVVDQKQTDLAGSALAFVLSHEIAHFYHRHATFRSFADQKKGTMPEQVSYQQEQQADHTGLLFAYMAGYDPEPVLDDLFETLYAQYQLVDNLWGYPTKTKRQQGTKLRSAEFRTFGYLFAVGHALYCREQFDEAARCFEYIFTRYPLKEAYSNFGVCRLQQLAEARKKDAISYFVLPFEFDPQNRLLRLSERSGGISAPQIAGWLKEAENAFDQAIKLDPGYNAAFLNQAMRALLANNALLSLGILTTLTQTTGRPLPPNGYLIQGMAYSVTGEWAKVDQSLGKARQAYQASYNMSVARAIRNKTVNSLQQPWKRLQPGTTPGCQTGSLALQEVDHAPPTIDWNRVPYLIELSNPRPYITVKAERANAITYFQVELGDTVQYFIRQNKPTRVRKP